MTFRFTRLFRPRHHNRAPNYNENFFRHDRQRVRIRHNPSPNRYSVDDNFWSLNIRNRRKTIRNRQGYFPTLNLVQTNTRSPSGRVTRRRTTLTLPSTLHLFYRSNNARPTPVQRRKKGGFKRRINFRIQGINTNLPNFTVITFNLNTRPNITVSPRDLVRLPTIRQPLSPRNSTSRTPHSNPAVNRNRTVRQGLASNRRKNVG